MAESIDHWKKTEKIFGRELDIEIDVFRATNCLLFCNMHVSPSTTVSSGSATGVAPPNCRFDTISYRHL